MSRAFADIVFTPSVLKEQEKRGGAGRYNEQFMAAEEERVDAVGPEQAEFIARMDSFYQSTINEETNFVWWSIRRGISTSSKNGPTSSSSKSLSYRVITILLTVENPPYLS